MFIVLSEHSFGPDGSTLPTLENLIAITTQELKQGSLFYPAYPNTYTQVLYFGESKEEALTIHEDARKICALFGKEFGRDISNVK